MATYQVLYWKNIPAQIKVYEGNRGHSYELSEAFQKEIDRVAMEQGLFGTDEYLDQFKWSEKREISGTPEEVKDRLIKQFEKELSSRRTPE